jgi:hypothetical protein
LTAYNGEKQAITRNPRLWLETWLSKETLIAHNAAYDAAVCMAAYPEHIPLWFRAYEEGRVVCTQTLAKLLDISVGRTRSTYSLQGLVQDEFGTYLPKDGWRMRYRDLAETPIEKWPDGAVRYAVDDAVWAFRLWEKLKNSQKPYFVEAYCDALWLHLASVWGLRVDLDRLEFKKREVERDRQELFPRLLSQGLVKSSGQKNTKAVAQAIESAVASPKLTERGHVKIDAVNCRAAGLDEFATYSVLGTVLSKDIPALSQGVIHTSFGIAASNRATSSSPNIQNWATEGGIRECFIPRDGWIYLQADYDSFELRGLANFCQDRFGVSRLGEVLRAGRSPLLDFAAKLGGLSYEDALAAYESKDPNIKKLRQRAKAAMYGFPGGMGIAKFRLIAAAQGLVLSDMEAQDLKNQWLVAYPEMQQLFDYVRSRKQPDETYTIETFNGFQRAGATYPAACNHTFQSTCAVIAKRAGWSIAKACYSNPKSPLYGSRTVVMAHDEFILETPLQGDLDLKARELVRLMEQAGTSYAKAVAYIAKPAIMERWYKKAEAVYDKEGRLQVWRPS